MIAKTDPPSDDSPHRIVLTMGDPHGIGPEIVLKALRAVLGELPLRVTLFGAYDFLHSHAEAMGLDLDWNQLEIVSVGEFDFPPRWGEVSQRAGVLALASLKEAASYCRTTGITPLVTAPVSKQALKLCGFPFPGQTEFVTALYPGCDPTMAFFSDSLNVLLATVHIALKEVPLALDKYQIVQKCGLFRKALQKLGMPRPRIAICGLNPHASEGGAFGTEEATLLEPMVSSLEREYGLESFIGPFPPDTVFRKAAHGEFDGVVALYHDQGLIPLKLLAFDSAVNTTLGLPIVRTSPDHGTAFDIAGRFVASPASLIAAIRIGLRLSA